MTILVGKITKARFEEMWRMGKTAGEISAVAGVSTDTIYGRARLFNMPSRIEPQLISQAREELRDRLEEDAVSLLENTLMRRHFTAATRDAIVSRLEVIVEREIRKRREKK